MEVIPPSPAALGKQDHSQNYDQDQSHEDDEGFLFVIHGVHPPCL
jgi:hypothetical protein